MNKKTYKISLILFPLFILLITFRCYCLDVPPLTGYVNDYARMMSPSVKATLEKELRHFEEAESTQIVILTIPSLGGEVLEEFSIKVADKWKIGHKGKDNGVIILVAKEERKIRIEVGKGLEGILTDLIAGRIIDMVIKPRFKRGDFDGGFVSGIHAIMDAVKGEFKGETKKSVPYHRRDTSPLWTLVIFLGVIIFVIGRFSKILSGILGAFGLPALAFFIFAPHLIFLILLGFIGLFAGILLPLIFHGSHIRRGGIHSGYWGVGSGMDLGSTGGFDGGGGEFGGGGASGDW
ncbi:MAG: TPM domain-containing protein [Syntrophorhabdaceae bacterium]|nr:TPM domain-containing protein [Syntrophorhabdaceae bacterium]